LPKNIRGWNCDEQVTEIFNELNIPKNSFSKTMNSIVKEWHNLKKEEETRPRPKPKIEVKIR
jgi:hypothetical protein